MVYRQIQIVTNLCNDATQKGIVPAGIIGCVGMFGVGLALVINTVSKELLDPSMLILLIVVCGETGFYLVFGLHGLAEIHSRSSNLLLEAKIKMLVMRKRSCRKWSRQFIESCPAIKMKFGGNNFVEMLTPLKSLGQAVEVAVQILLLGRNQNNSAT